MNMATVVTTPAKDRPTYTVTLRAEPNVNGILALRRLLKIASRQLGLRCIAAHEDTGNRP